MAVDNKIATKQPFPLPQDDLGLNLEEHAQDMTFETALMGLIMLICKNKELFSLDGSKIIIKEGNDQLNAIRIVQIASFLPELQCSQENIIVDNCINILNLESMPEIINENQVYYFDKFSFSRIIVNKIYPDKEEWLLYNKPLEEYSKKSVTNIPMLLFDPIENKNYFGVINIEVFSK